MPSSEVQGRSWADTTAAHCARFGIVPRRRALSRCLGIKVKWLSRGAQV